MNDSFWASGPAEYFKALKNEFEPKLNELRKRLDIASDVECADLETEINRVEAEYKSKLEAINDSNF